LHLSGRIARVAAVPRGPAQGPFGELRAGSSTRAHPSTSLRAGSAGSSDGEQEFGQKQKSGSFAALRMTIGRVAVGHARCTFGELRAGSSTRAHPSTSLRAGSAGSSDGEQEFGQKQKSGSFAVLRMTIGRVAVGHARCTFDKFRAGFSTRAHPSTSLRAGSRKRGSPSLRMTSVGMHIPFTTTKGVRREAERSAMWELPRAFSAMGTTQGSFGRARFAALISRSLRMTSQILHCGPKCPFAGVLSAFIGVA
jgi:hypothetical protein